MITADAFFNTRAERFAELSSLRHAVPAVFEFREFAAAGGVMSYGGSTTECASRAAFLPVYPIRAEAARL